MISRLFRRSAATIPSSPSLTKVGTSAESPTNEEEDEERTTNSKINEAFDKESHDANIVLTNESELKEQISEICESILNENVLLFLEWREIGRLCRLNSSMQGLCDASHIAPGMWMRMCYALGSEAALYVPANPSSTLLSHQSQLSSQTSTGETRSGADWRRLFFDSLWPARGKWGSGGGALSSGASSDFKINVCVRFRPLKKNAFDEKLGLPLHQYIRLRRQQAKNAGQASSSVTVGTVPPKQFLDGVFGSLMRDPVKLPSSGVIVDRFNAEKHIRQHGTDMMDDSPLTTSQLIELPELKEQLVEWREQSQVTDSEVDRVSRSVIVRDLVDSNSGLPPEVIEALVEAERISALSKRAEAASRDNGRPLESAEQVDEVIGAELGGDMQHDASANTTEMMEALLQEESQHVSLDLHEERPEIMDELRDVVADQKQSDFVERRRDTPRVLGLQPSRVVMFVPGHGVRNFNFSRVAESEQEQCYSSFAKPSVVSLLNGFNASLFCYGQTGGGKSHTIFGPPRSLDESCVVSSSGIVVRVLDELLSGAASITSQSKVPISIAFSAQYVEIYNDAMTDLLTGQPCEVLRSESNNISGAADMPVNSLEDGLLLLRTGQVRKRIAATAMNDRSSRAHSVFAVHMRQCRGDDVVTATLQLVDLAGSERLKKSKAEGSAKVEAVGINESLLVLGKVISALVESKSHVPYFESKLTTLLRSALGGASRTTAVVCCRAEDDHAFETLQALRFGERCGLVSNRRQQVGATSAKEALVTIDATLKQCKSSAVKLRERGKDHLPAFQSLEERIHQLTQRRQFIADIANQEDK